MDLLIQPNQPARQYWQELWRYRELFCFLAWRDLLVRYKQTVAGVAWALLRPLATMGVFTVVFGKLAKLPADGVAYPLLVLAALLPWQFFATAVVECGNSLVANANLVSKVFFPRMIVPASSVLTSLVDTLLAGCCLAGLMWFYQFAPTWRLLAVPLFAALALAAALGAGLWLAALTVRYRDFRLLAPFLLQLGFFISPVGYSSSVVPSEWRLLYSCNPMVGIIDGFRWAVLGESTAFYWPGLILSIALITLLFGTSLRQFRRMEESFADVI
jgi:lipopolysaccharide transport system permease protein